jgi:hypothetical protein
MNNRVPGYTGHVPKIQFLNGETYGRATRLSLGGPRDVRPPLPLLSSPCLCALIVKCVE